MLSSMKSIIIVQCTVVDTIFADKRRRAMPFISTKTNVTVTKEKEKQLKERLGQAISIIPGKSENWLMLAIEGDIPMYFRGDDSKPTAFIEVKIYGNASSDVYSRMTKELTGIYGDILGVTPDHMYIRYFGSDDWGWNGNNF